MSGPPELPACIACPRLAAFLADAREKEPSTWHNRPVPPWGDPAPRLLVVGLAPGYRGANRTGRPFCGDTSGRWVYRALYELGLAECPDPDACGGTLHGARITNAVKCVPPKNLPRADEIRRCRELWLEEELRATPATGVVALGRVAWESVCAVAGLPLAEAPFIHGAACEARLGGRPVRLVASFHPSPQNTNTGRLTWAAFLGALARGAA